MCGIVPTQSGVDRVRWIPCPICWLVVFVAISSTTGCGLSTRQETLEARLREQETQIRDLQAQLAEAEGSVPRRSQQRPDSQTELQSRESPIHPAGFSSQAESSVAELRFHGLTTGFIPRGQYDQDGNTTADQTTDQTSHAQGWLLNVVVQPVAEDGEVVMPQGQLVLQLSIPSTATDDDEVLIRRQYSATDIQQHWVKGLLASGVHLQIPFNSAQHSTASSPLGQLLLTASLEADGQPTQHASTLLDWPESSSP
jgi:uncharacterized coiled-coil protein SlyX/uncharacterized protein YgfB (UPF0149 family)